MNSRGLFDGDNCNQGLINTALVALKLQPNIKNNGSFLANIAIIYDEDVIKDMLIKHPSLQNPGGKVDLKTLEWFLDSYHMTREKEITSYIIAPFDTESNAYGADVLLRSIIGKSFPLLTTKPIFISDKQRDAVARRYKYNDYFHSTKYFMDLIYLQPNQARLMAEKFYHQLFENKNYLSPKDIKSIENNRLLIVGHGFPTDENIHDGGAKTHYRDIIKMLINFQLPVDTDIELSSCDATFGVINENTGKTEDKLVELFLAKKTEQLLGDQTKSYAYLFSKEIYASWPEYVGEISAYNGSTSFATVPAIYFRDPTDPKKTIRQTGYSATFKSRSGVKVDFDRNELQKKYKKSDFN